MNYLEGMKIVTENTLVGSGTFGDIGDIGEHGGSVGNDDFYARGDARNIWGDAKKPKNSKKKKKKKKTIKDEKNVNFPLYKRNVIELMSESEIKDIDLSCMVFTESNDHFLMFNTYLKSKNVQFKTFFENNLHISLFVDTDENILNIIDEYKNINFEKNMFCMIGEVINE